MDITRWSPMFPWDEFDKMMPKCFIPAVDIYQDNQNVIVEMTLPHFDPHKIDISIKNNVLHVKGSTDKTSEVEDKNYYRKEIRSGSFYRTIPLPTEVISEKTSAIHEDGVLKISMPKAAVKKEKTIKIEVKRGKAKKK